MTPFLLPVTGQSPRVRIPQAVTAGDGVRTRTSTVRQTVTETVPWGRLGVPMDIAKGIVFLASDDAGYMNGAGLVVDGGVTAT